LEKLHMKIFKNSEMSTEEYLDFLNMSFWSFKSLRSTGSESKGRAANELCWLQHVPKNAAEDD